MLVVDDAPSVEALRQLLELEGATVVAATSVREALEAVQAELPDLVITDIAMPDADGYELLSALRNNADRASLPVIAVTGVGRLSDVKRAIAAGFNAHMKKPISLERLVRTVLQTRQR